MKAILMSDRPKWCALMMNGDKKVEVRKGTALYKAIQKLIDEYGYADIYVYCSKINRKHYHLIEVIDTDTGKTEYEIDYYIGGGDYLDSCYEGKVAFKFRCYKVEEIKPLKHKPGLFCPYDWLYYIVNDSPNNLKEKSCLSFNELHTYLQGNIGCAIHISDLEIFDRPRELCEFHTNVKKEPPEELLCPECGKPMEYYEFKYLTRAPQSWMYVEAPYEN